MKFIFEPGAALLVLALLWIALAPVADRVGNYLQRNP